MSDLGIPVTGIAWLDMLALICAVMIALAGVAGFVWAKIRPHIDQAKAQIHKISEDSEKALDQVQNTHSTNLRHDLDGLGEKLDDLVAWAGRQESRQEEATRDVRGIRQDMGIMRGEARLDREQSRERDEALGQKIDAHIEDNRDYGPRLVALEQQTHEAP